MLSIFPLRLSRLPLVAASGLLFLIAPSGANAYTPESPEVKQAIERGLAYLQAHGAEELRLGGKCLIGLCFLKNGRPISDPNIQAGIKACRDSLTASHQETYSPALAL